VGSVFERGNRRRAFENYSLALTRDVAFADYASSDLIGKGLRKRNAQ
jgi:hypothetical protein